MSEHLPEFEMALAQYMGAGIAACYRGFRLYDNDVAKAVVAKWVSIYKTYRDIITSDIVHIRRPDGQQLDAFMHANAFLPVVFNRPPLRSRCTLRAWRTPPRFLGKAERPFPFRLRGISRLS